MTAPELREYILARIKMWFENKDVRESQMAVSLLNALAGDIEVVDLGEEVRIARDGSKVTRKVSRFDRK